MQTERLELGGRAQAGSHSHGLHRPVHRALVEGEEVAGIVGSISERGLLDRAFRDPTVVERTVGEVMDGPLPLVEVSMSLDDAFALLSGASGAPALVAVREERPAGVVTKLDLLEYLTHHPPSRG